MSYANATSAVGKLLREEAILLFVYHWEDVPPYIDVLGEDEKNGIYSNSYNSVAESATNQTSGINMDIPWSDVKKIYIVQGPSSTAFSRYSYSYGGQERWWLKRQCMSCLNHQEKVRMYCG